MPASPRDEGLGLPYGWSASVPSPIPTRTKSTDSDSQMIAKAADVGALIGRRWNLDRRQLRGNVRAWAQWTSVDGCRRGPKIKASALRFCPGPPQSPIHRSGLLARVHRSGLTSAPTDGQMMAIRGPGRPRQMVGSRDDAHEKLRGDAAVQFSGSGQVGDSGVRRADRGRDIDGGAFNPCRSTRSSRIDLREAG